MQIILNETQLNLILDIILEFVVDCVILWEIKMYILYKASLTIKKILSVLDINPFEYFFSRDILIKGYLKRKICALRKDNQMMKYYLDNKEDIAPLDSKLEFENTHEFNERNTNEDEFKKISEKKELSKKKSKAITTSENKELKGN